MPPELLPDLLEEIAHATDGLLGGQLDVTDWHNHIARELFAHSLAEYAKASGKDVGDVLDPVKKIVGGQIDALNAFTEEVARGDYADRSDALLARAALYAGGLKQAHYGGIADGYDLPCLPGACEECYSNCRCELDIKDDGVYWNCLEDDRSCASCLERGNSWQPYKGA